MFKLYDCILSVYKDRNSPQYLRGIRKVKKKYNVYNNNFQTYYTVSLFLLYMNIANKTLLIDSKLLFVKMIEYLFTNRIHEHNIYSGLVGGVSTPSTPAGQTSASIIPDFNETVISSTPVINDTTRDTTPSDVNDTTTAPGVSNRSPTTSPDVKASTTASADTSCDANYTATSSSLDFISPYYPENYRRYNAT